MIKRNAAAIMLIFIVLVSMTGCAAKSSLTQNLSSSASDPSKKEGAYRQVPAAMRSDVKEAEFDLEQAEKNVKLTKESVKLAELKKERAILNGKKAQLNQKLAEISKNKAEAVVEVKKAEAINNSGLGDSEDNIRRIANLRTRVLSIQTDMVKTQAEIDTTVLKIEGLDKKIRIQSKVVKRWEKEGLRTAKSKQKKK